MITSRPSIVDLSEIEPNRRRGGDLRAMLTPTTVGSTSGFMGLAHRRSPATASASTTTRTPRSSCTSSAAQLEVDLDGETARRCGPTRA